MPTELRTAVGWIHAVAFSPDGRRLAVGGNLVGLVEGRLRVWDLERPVRRADRAAVGGGRDQSPGLQPRRRRLAVGGGLIEGRLRVWDLERPCAVPLISWIMGGSINALVFSPDGRRLVSGDEVGVRVWDPERPDVDSLTLRSAGAPIQALTFSPDGRRLAVGVGGDGGDGMVRVWDVELAGAPRRPSCSRPGAHRSRGLEPRRPAAGRWR